MSSSRFQSQQFLLPKEGHLLSECEDVIGVNALTQRFAIADGATEAFDAQSWARRLARQWVRLDRGALVPDDFRSWVAAEGRSLHDSWKNLQLSWYAEEKARTGSFAAFVGVQLEVELATPRWQAIALGDACLLHCRAGRILSALPLANHESFNASPLLVPSLGLLQDAGLRNIVVDSGVLESGDVLLLLSDAVAAWYLRLAESGDRARCCFEELLMADREDELEQLFSKERRTGRIKNDDIAVLRIELRLP